MRPKSNRIRTRISATIAPSSHKLLKKHAYGNVSLLIELLVQAYDQGKMLTEEEIIEGQLNSVGEIRVKKAA